MPPELPCLCPRRMINAQYVCLCSGKRKEKARLHPFLGIILIRGLDMRPRDRGRKQGRSQSSQWLGARDNSTAESFQLSADRHFISIEINGDR